MVAKSPNPTQHTASNGNTNSQAISGFRKVSLGQNNRFDGGESDRLSGFCGQSDADGGAGDRTPAQVAGRSSGRFARPRRTARESGVSGTRGGGGSFRIWNSTWPRVNGGDPERHSYAVAAKEYTSCAGRASAPRSCSGLM